MLLQSGANSNVILTLNESKTLESPEYVIVFVCDHPNTKFACKLGTDLSDYPTRANKFTITVQEDAEPLDAEVSLANFGFYKYFVYEMADATEFDFDNVDDLDLDTMDGEVERGKMKYITTEDARAYYANLRQSVKTYGV
jgi:hypothetical protein